MISFSMLAPDTNVTFAIPFQNPWSQNTTAKHTVKFPLSTGLGINTSTALVFSLCGYRGEIEDQP
jgi:hypothetical protein